MVQVLHSYDATVAIEDAWRLREFVIIGDLVAKWLNLLKTL